MRQKEAQPEKGRDGSFVQAVVVEADDPMNFKSKLGDLCIMIDGALRPMGQALCCSRFETRMATRVLPAVAEAGGRLVARDSAQRDPSETAPRLHDRRHQGTDNRSGRGIICICFQEKRIA